MKIKYFENLLSFPFSIPEGDRNSPPCSEGTALVSPNHNILNCTKGFKELCKNPARIIQVKHKAQSSYRKCPAPREFQLTTKGFSQKTLQLNTTTLMSNTIMTKI